MLKASVKQGFSIFDYKYDKDYWAMDGGKKSTCVRGHCKHGRDESYSFAMAIVFIVFMYMTKSLTCTFSCVIHLSVNLFECTLLPIRYVIHSKFG